MRKSDPHGERRAPLEFLARPQVRPLPTMRVHAAPPTGRSPMSMETSGSFGEPNEQANGEPLATTKGREARTQEPTGSNNSEWAGVC